MGKGKRAGEKLCEHFRFRDHRWVRMRVLMRELEKELPRVRDRLTQPAEDGSPDYYGLLDNAPGASHVFPMEAPARAAAHARIETLEAALRQWSEPFPFEPTTPTPQPALRATPRL
jgi:hypothetical protein